MAKKSQNEEDLQHAYIQLQTIESQLKEIEHQITEVESKKQELDIMKESLSEFKKGKKNVAAFSPMGLGIYAKSKILDNEKLIVNIGSNIFMEKTADEVSKNISKQIKKFGELSTTLNQNYSILAIQNQALHAQLQEAFGGN